MKKTCPEPNQQPDCFPKQMLKKAVTAIRSKTKTERLLELCERIKGSETKSDAWYTKYQKFLASPVWKLVSDETIRKAHSKCECWGCTGRATKTHLLDFQEEHLEPGFDWMNRNDVLMALCSHHYEIVDRALMKKVVPLDRQTDSGVFAGDAGGIPAKEQESAC